jgi:2-aminoethylphosphonate-pyruvate transaminase
LREKSIIIYEGKGCFKGRVFQVGNIGELSNKDIRFFLAVQKSALKTFERRKPTLVTAILEKTPLLPNFLGEEFLVPDGSI